MEETKEQHIVPSAYLKRFTFDEDKGRDTKIYFFNINNKHNGITNTNHMPKERNFYDIEELAENKKILENYFNRIETKMDRLLHDLSSKIIIAKNARRFDYVDITNSERSELSAQVAFMIVRTRSFRNMYHSIYSQIVESGKNFSISIPEYSKSDIKRVHNKTILNHEIAHFYANLFDDSNCVFLINHTNTPFITSDSPVVMINHNKDGSIYPSLPNSVDVTHFFPISPKVGIQFYHKSIAKKDSVYFDINDERMINFFNNEIIKNANLFLFSNESLLNRITMENNYDQTGTVN